MDMESLMPIAYCISRRRTDRGRKEERGSERSDPPPAATAPPVECMLLLLLSVPGDATGHVHRR